VGEVTTESTQKAKARRGRFHHRNPPVALKRSTVEAS
jgi:hypothetical protein